MFVVTGESSNSRQIKYLTPQMEWSCNFQEAWIFPNAGEAERILEKPEFTHYPQVRFTHMHHPPKLLRSGADLYEFRFGALKICVCKIVLEPFSSQVFNVSL